MFFVYLFVIIAVAVASAPGIVHWCKWQSLLYRAETLLFNILEALALRFTDGSN